MKKVLILKYQCAYKVNIDWTYNAGNDIHSAHIPLKSKQKRQSETIRKSKSDFTHYKQPQTTTKGEREPASNTTSNNSKRERNLAFLMSNIDVFLVDVCFFVCVSVVMMMMMMMVMYQKMCLKTVRLPFAF